MMDTKRPIRTATNPDCSSLHLARLRSRLTAPLLFSLLIMFVAMPRQAEAGGLFGNLFKMSQAQESEIAKEMNAKLAKDPGLITEGKDYELVQEIGARLVDKNALEEYEYHFFLIDQEEVNAFATPAGYIYVTQGLLDVMAYDPAMVAGVMAHELGHAKDRHVAKGYEQMVSGAMGLTLLGMLLGDDYADVMDVLFVGGQVVYLKYNRDQEEWADRYGVDLSYGAGYDAYGMVRALQCLEALYGSADEVAVWLAHHPATDDRIARVSGIAYGTSGREHGYLLVPKPPSEEHPLWELYGTGEVVKQTAPITSGIGTAQSFVRKSTGKSTGQE